MSEYETLIQLLDEGIEMLRDRARLLDEIKGHVQNRRLDKLEAIVAEDDPGEHKEEKLARRLSEQCRAVAAERGYDCEGDRISELIKELEGRQSFKLQDKRQRLVFAINEVQQKAECLTEMANQARDIEERMILAILGQPEDIETYGGNGQMEQDRHGIAVHQEV